MGMDTWIWLILCIVFIVAEAATTALISVWFAVGAAAALVASIFTNSPVVQFVVFALVSAVTLAVMVPTLVKRRASKKPPVTNGSQLTVGKRGVVLKAIVPGSIGRVRVDGLDWQATADSPLPEGAPCQVTAAEGMKAQGIDLRQLNLGAIVDVFEELEEDIVNVRVKDAHNDLLVRVYVE